MGVDQRNLDVVIEGEDGQGGGKADWRLRPIISRNCPYLCAISNQLLELF